MEKTMRKLRLILGDQLNINHSWFDYPDDDCIYVMMEIKQEKAMCYIISKKYWQYFLQ